MCFKIKSRLNFELSIIASKLPVQKWIKLENMESLLKLNIQGVKSLINSYSIGKLDILFIFLILV